MMKCLLGGVTNEQATHMTTLNGRSPFDRQSAYVPGATRVHLTTASAFFSGLTQVGRQFFAAAMLVLCLGTAASAATPTIDFPSAGSTLSGDKQTFLFNKRGLSVSAFWVHAGPSVGSTSYINSGSLGAGDHHELAGFPQDGSIVYFRLWYRQAAIGSRWQFKDYQFTAQQPNMPKMITPRSFGEQLTGSAVRFHWDDNSFGAESYKLGIGLEPGFELAFWSWDNLYHSGPLDLDRVVADGLIRYNTVAGGYYNYVYLGLYAKRPGEDYVLAEYQIVKVYNGAKVPSITTPAPFDALTSTSELFNWTSNGTAVSDYWIYVGARLGGLEYYSSGSLGTALSHTVPSLPSDGSEVYVRLWYKNASGWKFSDEQYRASGVGPEIIDPTPGSWIDDLGDTISWTDNGTGVSEWRLTAGHNPGGRWFYDSGNLGSANSVFALVSSPHSGLSYNVRLWHRTVPERFWRHTDFYYTSHD